MYTIKQLPEFSAWLFGLKDSLARRLEKAQKGNLGDVQPVGGGVFNQYLSDSRVRSCLSNNQWSLTPLIGEAHHPAQYAASRYCGLWPYPAARSTRLAANGLPLSASNASPHRRWRVLVLPLPLPSKPS